MQSAYPIYEAIHGACRLKTTLLLTEANGPTDRPVGSFGGASGRLFVSLFWRDKHKLCSPNCMSVLRRKNFMLTWANKSRMYLGGRPGGGGKSARAPQ